MCSKQVLKPRGSSCGGELPHFPAKFELSRLRRIEDAVPGVPEARQNVTA